VLIERIRKTIISYFTSAVLFCKAGSYFTVRILTQSLAKSVANVTLVRPKTHSSVANVTLVRPKTHNLVDDIVLRDCDVV
jgi:hypothetical protein